MKNLYCFFLLTAFPFIVFSQNIHGIWTGTMVNDTLKVIQNFEIGLSEYRGQITGYTYQTYIIRDTFYYSVKRIRAERKDGFLVVEDVERVGDNFPEKAARKVKMISKFPLINDSTIDFTKGHWSTNQTKVYYSVGGDVRLKELQDEKQSELLSHLQEANIKNDLAVNNEKKNQESIAKNQPATRTQQTEQNKIPENQQKDIAKNSPVQKPAQTVSVNNNLQDNAVTKSLVQNKNETTADPKDEVKPEREPHKNIGVNQAVATNNNPQKADLKNQELLTNKTIVTNKPEDTVIERSINSQTAVNTIAINVPTSQKKESIAGPSKLPSIVAERKNENMQDLYFKNDSLVLSLYDNGIVDGDTVSVFVNGETIISKQMLKAAAIKKTIYIPSSTDTVQLILFAENLGTIPPNTGLLIVHDGDDSYQVHFSADLQTNASITLKRRKG